MPQSLQGAAGMRVGDVMNPVTAVVGAMHTLRQASQRMIQHNTGAAVVIDAGLPGPAVITERDLLHAIAAGMDVDDQNVLDHMKSDLVVASPDWAVTEAATLMVKHGIRHVLVFDVGELVGVLSMRDVVRVLRLGSVPVPTAQTA